MKSSVLDKLAAAPEGSFHVLDEAKAKKLGGKTMYIPSVADVREAVCAIPFGSTRTVLQLRAELARVGNAEIVCPAATTKYFKWLVYASEAESGEVFPWWRVVGNGKWMEKMPGGVEKQRRLLLLESSA